MLNDPNSTSSSTWNVYLKSRSVEKRKHTLDIKMPNDMNYVNGVHQVTRKKIYLWDDRLIPKSDMICTAAYFWYVSLNQVFSAFNYKQ